MILGFTPNHGDDKWNGFLFAFTPQSQTFDAISANSMWSPRLVLIAEFNAEVCTVRLLNKSSYVSSLFSTV
jgi:hypothetical protein